MTLKLFDQNKLATKPSSINLTDVSIGAGSCLTDSYQQKIAKLKEDVLIALARSDLEVTGTFDYDLTLDTNKAHVDKIKTILAKIPKLATFVKVKPVMPVFDEIMVEGSDTQEIKKFIRKANYDFLGFHCNHKMFDKQYDKLDSTVVSIYESSDYKEYDKIIESFASTLYSIISADKKGESIFYGEVDHHELDAKKMTDIILKLNGKIISANANVSPSCAKCEAAVRR